ncbi:MAG TPA: ATP-dependent zinc metalloprotease FtsH [Fimbriimonadaceae bacterium]|nr:ATP-dependent zinc metalloprotease FtsH [Fimbriimonadaceae bacterium]
MNKSAKGLIAAVLALLALLFVLNSFGNGSTLGGIFGKPPVDFSYSELLTAVKGGRVKTAEWQGQSMTGQLMDGSKYEARVPSTESDAGTSLAQQMQDNKVDLKIAAPPVSAAFMQILIFLVPVAVIIAFYLFFIKPAQQGGTQAMNFGRSKARRVGEQSPKVTFDDVAGIDEAKEELSEIVDYLKNTKKYVALGAKIPKGILLTGPPGVGKTHLARAIAGEAGVPFFHISGSDFVEMFVGVGAARVRDLFETAKAHRPCLIFVDEIDAVGRQRGAGLGGGHDEREQTLNQLLVEMDGFDANTGVIMIAATNRPDVLDPALLRPGRFDRRIVVDSPDINGREAILKIHAKGKPLADDVDLATIAKRTPGFTGADLANSLNEAALLAARRNHTMVHMSDVEEALDRVMAGPERKSRIIDDDERKVLAYHEAGHAIIGELLEECDPVHKVTILPRGMSLGSTWALPEKETFIQNEQELLDDIAMSLGGRVAEEVVYNTVWTGSSSDLKRVTHIARAMVCEFGMSEKLGTLQLGHRSRNPFLGRDYISEDRDYSEEVAQIIDEEVRRIVEGAHSRAKDLLISHRTQLDAVVEALLDRETLDREEFLAALNGEPLPEKRKVSETKTPDAPEEKASDEPGAKRGAGKLEPGTASGQA